MWDALESVIKEHPVMLNRAPPCTAWASRPRPVLVEAGHEAPPLGVHRLNADFDGDQMAIHVPLSAEAQAEARILMLAANNLLKPSDGGPVTVPTQDMVLGSYYLTYERDPEPDPDFSYQTPAEAAKALADGQLMENDRVWVQDEEMGRWYRTTPALCAEAKDGKAEEVYNVFSDDNEAQLAYAEGILDLHEPIMVRRSAQIDGEVRHKLVRTTVGRLLFNEGIPQDLEFVDRNDPEQVFEPEINFMCGKKQLGQIVDRCISKHGFTRSAEVLDTIKARGYKFSTRGALTVAIADMTVPDEKRTLIAKTEQDIVKIENQYKRGFLTNDERYRLVVSAWEKTTNEVSDALQASMDKFNPIFMMADSGARGSMKQIRQLAGMRGLMADTAGRTIEIPIKANFREGLSVLEYFISSRGARKGMADTALRTADSGYLTRRLVDVSQEVIIREDDCGTTDGITVSEIGENGQVIEPLVERLKGRYLAEDLTDRETGQVLVGRNTLVDGELAKFIEEKLVEQAGPDGRPAIKVRSVLTCEAHSGVCAKCYGMNLAFSEPVGMGEAVGIIAAQSIGEPGTQLTMRTFHTGGVAGGDITQGLPRVEELLEARKPKKMAQLAEISGVVTVEETKRTTLCNLTITADDGEVVTYAVPYSSGIRVKNGDRVTKGQRLTDGALSPHEVLRIRGVDAVHNYLIQEVQKPYRQQGVDINDKHIEVIVRQMMRKVRVEESGDSELLSGSTVDIIEYRDACAAVRARIAAGEKREDGEELVLPTCTRLLLGITKASLATESFLSAASFQETTKVLTEAAIKGKVDHLLGLKENVIIGKLIPAGSGLAAYRKLDEIEDEVHDEGRFREVAVLADDLREDEEPSAPAEADEAAEEEDEVLSVTLEGEDEVPEDGEE